MFSFNCVSEIFLCSDNSYLMLLIFYKDVDFAIAVVLFCVCQFIFNSSSIIICGEIPKDKVYVCFYFSQVKFFLTFCV